MNKTLNISYPNFFLISVFTFSITALTINPGIIAILLDWLSTKSYRSWYGLSNIPANAYFSTPLRDRYNKDDTAPILRPYKINYVYPN